MKGLAIYTIVAVGIFLLGTLYNIGDGSATGYSLFGVGVIIPMGIFAIMFLSRKNNA